MPSERAVREIPCVRLASITTSPRCPRLLSVGIVVRTDRNELLFTDGIATVRPQRLMLISLACFAAMFGLAWSTPPVLPDGTDAAAKRLAIFKVPDGMKVELFAAEPKLASPVAIGLDERNRVYVAEEYRFNLGTEENRTRPFLLEDDLQIQTLDDRLKMYEKYASKFEGGMDWFRKVADQVRLVEDTDGDGKGDRSTVFAPAFNGTLDGLAAGVMAMDGDVYFTCIPNLWRLRDTDGDGVADERQIVHTGFGVNAGFLGHDLHGLCWGPDGKLYFSIGDRGFHVTTADGAVFHGPRNGAVFRCFPDGSEFEVVCRGLRNPQELAFDQFGNLFADDNNCDKGDHSRLVFCLDGSDSGWNMAYQSIAEPYLTGPWHAEKIWHLWNGDLTGANGKPMPDPVAASGERPAWALPPVGKLGAGPSGFTYYPGTGLPAKYDHHFFMCNYTGSGGIDSFSLKPRGAGFETTDEHDFMKPISATDCEFGYDGKLYVSDFVSLIWNGGSAGGRIYTVFDPRIIAEPSVRQTAEIVRAGFKQRTAAELIGLLSQPDQRIRQRSQFELASRGETSLPLLKELMDSSKHRLSRLHALWGLGQLAGSRGGRGLNDANLRAKACATISAYLSDDDAEIRAWSARILGEQKYQPALVAMTKLLTDQSPRVKLFATLAMQAFPDEPISNELLALIRDNNDVDPWLRHASVMALSRKRLEGDQLNTLVNDKSPAIRMAILLAVRHGFKRDSEWAGKDTAKVDTKTINVTMQTLLRDEQLHIVTEAARVINDLPLEESFPALAMLSSALKGSAAATVPEPLARRIINANYRLGAVENARRVLEVVTEPSLSPAIRSEALRTLIDWEQDGPRDRVTGFWRLPPPYGFAKPMVDRDPQETARLKAFLTDNIATLLSGAGSELQPDVLKLISRYELPTDDNVFASWIADQTRSNATQAAALQLLASRRSPLAANAIGVALKSDRPIVRAEARDALAVIDPTVGVGALRETLNSESAANVERQRALAMLGKLKNEAADAILVDWMTRLNSDRVPDALQLDVLDAATTRGLPDLKAEADRFAGKLAEGDLIARHRVSLHGGDADRGREVFLGHRTAQCVRCHKVGTNLTGGNAGPDLNLVATRHDRLSLLQSLVDPSAKIAKGFETVTLVMSNGQVYGGVIRSETNDEIVLEKPDGAKVTVKVADVEERSQPKSAMPEMNRNLSARELRDLVEFLTNLK